MEKDKKFKKGYHLNQFTLQLVSLLLVVALSIILSLVNMGFDNSIFYDPQKTFDFIMTLCVNIFCGIYGLSMGESYSKDKHMTQDNSLYQANLSEYCEIREKVDMQYSQFEQWITYRGKKEFKQKKIERLNKVGLNGAFILSVIDQIERPEDLLIHPMIVDYKGQSHKVRRMNKDQVKAVIAVKGGKVKYKHETASYYYTQHEFDNGSYLLEEAHVLRVNETKVALKARIQKGILSFVSAFIMATIVIDTIKNPNIFELIYNIISKLGLMICSTLGGYRNGIELVKYKSTILKNKSTAMQEFRQDIDDKVFVPLTDEEIAEQELEELEFKDTTFNEIFTDNDNINFKNQTKSDIIVSTPQSESLIQVLLNNNGGNYNG